jgi:peptidoglycan-associated lipoprotein
MKRVWVGLCVAVLLAGCETTGGGGAQKDVFKQPTPDAAQAAADQARRAAEEEAKRRADAARRAEEEARRVVVQPLPDAGLSEKPLDDPASMLKDPASLLSKGSVYYDLDMYNIGEEFQPLVEAHAKLLRDHKDLRVRVEGNCDERGSREYNLALGQRRADAIKRAMTLLGVPVRQIDAVSFGAEKPKMASNNEEAWAENRRSDIVYDGLK